MGSNDMTVMSSIGKLSAFVGGLSLYCSMNSLEELWQKIKQVTKKYGRVLVGWKIQIMIFKTIH